jgi:hypothetical protein
LAAPWSEGRLKAFVTSVLRSGTRRYPPKYECLNEAYVGQRLNTKTNREGKHYLCTICEGEYPAKEVVVDHIEPVVHPEHGFISWDVFIERLFCSKDNLQVLCVGCHKIKSYNESQQRKESNGSKKSPKE